MSKRKSYSQFSIDSIRDEVNKEVDNEKLSDNILSSIRSIDLRAVGSISPEVVLFSVIFKFGLSLFLSLSRVACSLSVLPHHSRRQVVSLLHPHLSEGDVDILLSCLPKLKYYHRIGGEDFTSAELFCPPTSHCFNCKRELVTHNRPVKVEFFGVSGPREGYKVSLKCNHCGVFYGYSKFGNPSAGWSYYNSPRFAVESSDVCLVERSLLRWQISLSCHCWVSFSGFSVSYSEAHLACGLTEKRVANAFWNGELESELRDRGELDMFGLCHTDSDREVIMAHIDNTRAQSNYSHPPEDCTDDCKARGCGKLWVGDGQWKLMFAHCMMKRKNVVDGLPLINYPDVCTAAPVHGKAFCQEHLDFFNLLLSGDDNSKVESILKSLTDSASMSIGHSTIVAQGNEEIFANRNSCSLLEDCEEDVPTSCNKETGEKQRLQKWSRGHFFIVRGSGIIDKWNPLFRSESPSQAFLIMLNWLIVVLKGLDPSTWCQLYLAYDNMCHVDGMRIAKKPLPLPQPYSHMWLKINKIIDSLHISNHKDSNCKLKYDPLSLKEELPDVNTMAAEQTFVWLSRFKKILCAMPKVHHLFFLHRIIVHRNLYTVSCYKRGLKPVLPVVRKKT
ncbi:hypothetical protein ACROYT_G024334 [Oculina patagonica]